MADRKIKDDILEIPALYCVKNILFPGIEYEIRINKLPEISEKSYLKLKTILNERCQKQMEIAIACLESVNSFVCFREWGVLARIIRLSSLKIDTSPLDLRMRIMGRCRVLRFFQNKEQENCFFADIKISPVLAVSEEEWKSDIIKKLKDDIVEDFYDFSDICAEIAVIYADNAENYKDLERKFSFLSLFSQKIANNIKFSPNFEEFIEFIINEWLESVCSEKETVFNYKFYLLSLDSELKQMLAIKNTINNFVEVAENALSILLNEGLSPENKNFSVENGQSPEKSRRDSPAIQKELFGRLEEALKKLNALKEKLGGEGNDAKV